MPGNETTYKSPRSFLPALWVENNVPQSADRVLEVAGAPSGLSQFPVAQCGSITSIVVVLSEAVTAGEITVSLRKNGVNLSSQVIVPADGTTKIGAIPPGEAHYDPGDTVGVHVASSSGLQPNAQIDLGVYLELQNL